MFQAPYLFFFFNNFLFLAINPLLPSELFSFAVLGLKAPYRHHNGDEYLRELITEAQAC